MTGRHCVVLAGGLGTRIREVTHGLIPKVLVPVLGRPFLEHKLESLRSMGIDSVTILVGELGDLVDDFVSSLDIPGLACATLHDGPALLGTAGSIARALDHLPDSFWVTYGDSYVVADLDAAEAKVGREGELSVMSVLHNRDDLEPSNCSVASGFITDYRKGAALGTFEWIDYGLLYMRRASFSSLPADAPTDLYDVLTELIGQHQVIAHEVTERFWDVGTPEALRATEAEFARRLSR